MRCTASLAVVACVFLCGVASAKTAEQIVREAIKSQGGHEKLAGIKNLAVHVTYKTLGKNKLEGELYELYQPPDRLVAVLRSDVKPDVIKVYDGTRGRFMRRGHEKVFVMDKRDLLQMKESLSRARLLILTNLFVEGARFALMSKTVIPGGLVIYKVRWSGPAGQVIRLSIDGSQYLLHGATFGGSGSLKVKFGKHRVYNGIRLPSRISVYEGGKKTIRISVGQVTFNRKLAQDVFTDPVSAAKLVEQGLVEKK